MTVIVILLLVSSLATVRPKTVLQHVLAIVEASVRLYIRQSVTPCSPIKTMQARITKSSLMAATRTVAFVTIFLVAG